MRSSLALLLVASLVAACGGGSPPPPAPTPPSAVAEPVAPQVAAAPADRCTQLADHFEPWRTNEYWKDEVSPRDKLIADCRDQHWKPELLDCLMAANNPLELDDCIPIDP